MAASGSNSPTRVYRADYKVPPFLVPTVELQFDLEMERTIVATRLELQPNPDYDGPAGPVELDAESLELLAITIDGRPLSAQEFNYDGQKIRLPNVVLPAVVSTRVAVNPGINASKIGLNPSQDGDIFSQCEAEGFRKFSPMLDRPDVLSVYDVTLRANKGRYPALLSNGHPIAKGDLDDGRHWVRWHDPIPKPTFIFCIVAGNLVSEQRTYKTASDRLIEVGLYTPAAHLEACRASLDFVFEAMKWDEAVFGREYDLGVFNICVLNGFLGAMENKGLNLFDLAWAVAHPSNTTDDEYEYRLKSVGHEYFHNWSGDRVTIRNWFQTSLKEGLTRFRDQLFLGDLTEFDTVRIRMAQHIRGNQFTEDDSGVAHAPILESYIDTRNVYSVTVYDKGQEIIFMLYNLVGRATFEKAVATYFDRHASQAVTIEEFLKAFEEVAGLDLSQFRRWYYQAGLTEVAVRSHYDEERRTYRLDLQQTTRPTPGQPDKQPHHIPIAVGLVGADGAAIPMQSNAEDLATSATRVLELRENEQSFVFENVPSRPTLSLLRGFSAPVRIQSDESDDDLARLLRHDSDLFARWDAGQRYATRLVAKLISERASGNSAVDHRYVEAVVGVLADKRISGRAMTEILTLPDERTLGEIGPSIDVDGVHFARENLAQAIASGGQSEFWRLFEENVETDPVARDNVAVGRRKIANLSLAYLARLPENDGRQACLKLVKDGKNFTQQVGALYTLAERGGSERDEALTIFHERHGHDQLALDQWYKAQITAARDDTAKRVEELMEAPDFNPVFSRIFAFCDVFFYRNRYGLNAPGGYGYDVLVRQMMKLDQTTPMLAGWTLMRSDLTRWWKFDEVRQQAMRGALMTMLDTPGVSAGLYEACSTALDAGARAAAA